MSQRMSIGTDEMLDVIAQRVRNLNCCSDYGFWDFEVRAGLSVRVKMKYTIWFKGGGMFTIACVCTWSYGMSNLRARSPTFGR
jgi:hypothetical protein